MYKELKNYQRALQRYIESTYHASSEKIVALRRRLLEVPGAIAQERYLESTPRYRAGRPYGDLEIPAPAKALLSWLSSPAGGERVFEPPYSHQADALEAMLGERHRDLVVSTGTGSGKTETFLLPILARCAVEASNNRSSFSTRAVRAILLYPMNALVNDQLGRLRLLFGAPETASWFTERAGRSIKFARYTGRTLYPGVRRSTGKKRRHQKKLAPLAFYLDLEKRANGGDDDARSLIRALRDLGKWPAKPSTSVDREDGMTSWWGSGQWRDPSTRELRRTVERDQDPELLIRHEVQESPPDLLVTNYSMLEYMLLRPIERGIFTRTRNYFAQHPEQRLFLVLDEAHLYRGAQGTEVAMLIRRLRTRLGLAADQVQAVCTSASFSDPSRAADFAGGLCGKPPEGFTTLTGDKAAHTPAGPGDKAIADVLAQVHLPGLRHDDLRTRAIAVAPLLRHRASEIDADPQDIALADSAESAPGVDPLAQPLYQALFRLPVTGRLRNLSSGATCDEDLVRDPPGVGPAQSIRRLAGRLFPGVSEDVARDATDALVELCSIARPSPDEAPLLTARVHAFFRGLPGLWACVDPECAEIPRELLGGPTGQLHAQPLRSCTCGARVFELHTCRDCGAAYLLAYTTSPEDPEYLWSEDVGEVEGADGVVWPVQIALEDPDDRLSGRLAYLDTRTGRLGGSRGREIWLAPVAPSRAPRRGSSRDSKSTPPGFFAGCARCGAKDKISDHTTKGDEPFQELVSAQLLEQPPRPGVTTPLRGRKALIFSDGRQPASRLAGKLESYSLRDAVRPLLLDGLALLEERFERPVALRHAYPALLAACHRRRVHLRPQLAADFDRDRRHIGQLLDSPGATWADFSDRSARVGTAAPASVLEALYPVLGDTYTGVERLALAAPVAVLDTASRDALAQLPAPPGALAAEPFDDDRRRSALLDLWVRIAMSKSAPRLPNTPPGWIDSDEGPRLPRTKGRFEKVLVRLLDRSWHRKHLRDASGPWPVFLRDQFVGAGETAKGFLLEPSRIGLVLQDAVDWARCTRCTAAQAVNPFAPDCCVSCGGAVELFRPATHKVFRSRKEHYRKPTERLLRDGHAPHPFVSAEHTAQLNDAGDKAVFSRAEWYELRFQDLDAPGPDDERSGPIDVLSCTTTMEVGIDIGYLIAVALRNVPPGRANYQQRAGRAGRRGSALSTVITFANADSHDQRFFAEPKDVVSGLVPDPLLHLDNVEIIRRHCFAAVMSSYQQYAIPDAIPDDVTENHGNVFSSLGRATAFRRGVEGELSYRDLAIWLADNRAEVLAELQTIIPAPVVQSHGAAFVDQIPDQLLTRLREIGAGPLEPRDDGDQSDNQPFDDEDDDWIVLVADDDDSDEQPRQSPDADPDAPGNADLLLDRLFDQGVLPRYAFPTDVVTFHVFDRKKSSDYGAVLRYAPQRGLNQALSTYAPGREVWVDGMRHYSLAIWTPFPRDRHAAYQRRQYYFECERCGYARLGPREEHYEGETLTCVACKHPGGLGPAMKWFSPPGFAHPIDQDQQLATRDAPPRSRPTRAKLSAPFTDQRPPSAERKSPAGNGYTVWSDKDDLLMTNRGIEESDKRGFRYCTRCGRAEPNGWPLGALGGASHKPPGPRSRRDPSEECSGSVATVALGSTFSTDIVLFRFTLAPPARLLPGTAAARITLTTLANALASAAVRTLDIEPNDVSGEYRPSMTPAGERGEAVDVYLYDLAPGGAGFVQEAAADADRLLDAALTLLDRCDCTHSCYQCLRSYSNRYDHADLDRRLAAALLRHCLYDDRPVIPTPVEDRLLEQLALDLRDSGEPVESRDGALTLTNSNRVIVLGHPFAPDLPGSARAERHAAPHSSGVIVIPQLIVERALPVATERARGEQGDAAPDEDALPPTFSSDPAGLIPVYRSNALKPGLVDEPVPTARIALPGAPDGAFVMRLDAPTLEELQDSKRRRLFRHGAWLVFTRTAPDDFPDGEHDHILLIRRDSVFRGTGAPWTLGRLRQRMEGDRAILQVRYTSRRAQCRPECLLVADARSLGRIFGVIAEDGRLQRLTRGD